MQNWSYVWTILEQLREYTFFGSNIGRTVRSDRGATWSRGWEEE